MNIRQMQDDAYANALVKGFWDVSMELSQDASKSLTDAIYAQKIALIHAELSEALEALREGDENFAEELADVVIRVADLTGYYGVDLEREIARKIAKNKDRPRLHGKAF